MNTDWTELKLEIVFAPKTGSIKPWEIWAVFPDKRVHWSSLKTEENANKKLNRLNKLYSREYCEKLNRLQNS